MFLDLPLGRTYGGLCLRRSLVRCLIEAFAMSGCRVSRRSIFLATNTILEGGTAVGNCFARQVLQKTLRTLLFYHISLYFILSTGKNPLIVVVRKGES